MNSYIKVSARKRIADTVVVAANLKRREMIYRAAADALLLTTNINNSDLNRGILGARREAMRALRRREHLGKGIAGLVPIMIAAFKSRGHLTEVGADVFRILKGPWRR
jgi:hypothetical protein